MLRAFFLLIYTLTKINRTNSNWIHFCKLHFDEMNSLSLLKNLGLVIPYIYSCDFQLVKSGLSKNSPQNDN